MFENVPILGDIISFLSELVPVQSWIDSGYNFISDLSFAEQFLGLILGFIIVLLGVFSLIKKLSKLIIVVAILFGLWLLYANGVFG